MSRTSGAGPGEAAAALAETGMPEDQIDAVLGLNDDAGEEDDRFEIWETNVRSLNCFLTAAGRRYWRLAPMGGILGLDYDGVGRLLAMRGIEVDADLLDDLAGMDDAAVEILNAKS